MNYKVKPITVAVGAVLTAGLAGAAFADTEENPFALDAAEEGYDLLADSHGEGECGEGKCGEEGDDGGEGKCGEGKCGDDDGGDDDGGDEEEADEEAADE